MQISIIGVGRVGSALGRAWAANGHRIGFGARDLDKPTTVALAREVGADVALPATAVLSADVAVLALPWRAAADVVPTLDGLDGKPVIDCMNPLTMGPDGLTLDRGHMSSGGEAVQAWLPQARVVKTLNQVGAEVMADTSGFPVPPAMFMAGDDPAAKEIVSALLTDLGFEPLDAGGLTQSRILEPLGLVWINQSMARGLGRDWAFGIMRRAG